jgi:hypothetical protein
MDMFSMGRALLRHHLQHRATQAMCCGTSEEAGALSDELVELISKHAR